MRVLGDFYDYRDADWLVAALRRLEELAGRTPA